MATAGYALMLQVAHPTVGAGVHEHSNFEADPWGRLLRTLDYTTVMVYGSPELAGPMGRRIHEMHKHIKGTKPNGERYFALEPGAYAWVHATLAQSIVAGSERFARRMSPVEVERFYAEWLGVGRLIGVPAGELPERWADFRAYFDRMVDERLEDNETVHTVLRTLARPKRAAAADAERPALARGEPRRWGGSGRSPPSACSRRASASGSAFAGRGAGGRAAGARGGVASGDAADARLRFAASGPPTCTGAGRRSTAATWPPACPRWPARL